MTVVKIERNRDTYICTNHLGKQSYYNTETNEMVGFNGKPLKNVTSTLKPFSHLWQGTPQKEFVDRLISLNLLSWNNLQTYGNSCALNDDEVGCQCSALLKKAEWKKTLENLRNKTDREENDFRELISYLYLRMIFKQMNLPKFENIDFIHLLSASQYSSFVLKCFPHDWAKKALVKWMVKVDSHFDEINESLYLVTGKRIDLTDNRFNQITHAFQNNLFHLCDMIKWKDNYPELTYDEKKSIVDNCAQWTKDVEHLKNTEVSERFKKTQTEKDYSFSNSDYTVTIPTSYADCQDISNKFHNCVAHFYWDYYLKDGHRLVVLINRKDRPVICCGIDRKTLEIVDFLRPRNQPVTSASALNFLTEYQNYLNSLL